MDTHEIIARLKADANGANVAGMARFGITTDRALGIGHTTLKAIARDLRRAERDPRARHRIAGELWASGIHEARLLATIVDPPALVTRRQADAWVREIDSWDVCDGFAYGLMSYVPFAYDCVEKWAKSEREYVRRAAFALIAGLAVHDKEAPDEAFTSFFPLMRRYATDDRNFVKKAVNWALRQVGKRNARLQRAAVAAARQMLAIDSRPARWIARDALRELERRTDNETAKAARRAAGTKATSSRSARRP